MQPSYLALSVIRSGNKAIILIFIQRVIFYITPIKGIKKFTTTSPVDRALFMLIKFYWRIAIWIMLIWGELPWRCRYCFFLITMLEIQPKHKTIYFFKHLQVHDLFIRCHITSKYQKLKKPSHSRFCSLIYYSNWFIFTIWVFIENNLYSNTN